MTAIPSGVETATDDREKTVIIGSEGSSSSSVVEIAKPDEVVSLIKEEELDVVDSSLVGFAKPLEGLYEMGPTPFLRKTFEMVDDSETDPVLSWSPTRKSFVIWDSYKFSENLLPKYFKHKNFSSFLRQLNTYGFRKVDSGKWEFANEGFQGGKKHLLKSIKRRSKNSCNKDVSNAVVESETEVESLKKDQSSMRLELLKLNQRQEESSHEMDTVQDKIQGVESGLQQMISFFEKLAKDQRFTERLMRKRRLRKQQRELEATEFVKKLKLLQGRETQEKLPYVESDLIIGQDMDMTATQPDPKALIDDGFIDGGKTVVDVNGRDSKFFKDLEDMMRTDLAKPVA